MVSQDFAADYYRRMAMRVMEIAWRTRHAGPRRELLQVAVQFEKLAEHVEARHRPPEATPANLGAWYEQTPVAASRSMAR